jgi:DNA/RNA endonuclease YhcR with UshA esterase domain
MKHLFFFTVFFYLFYNKASSQSIISAKHASQHIGETVKVVDMVFSSKRVMSSKLILLNIGGYYDDKVLTILIPDSERNKVIDSPNFYNGKYVMVTGKLINYKGKPAIVVNRRKQLKVILIDNFRNPVITN